MLPGTHQQKAHATDPPSRQPHIDERAALSAVVLRSAGQQRLLHPVLIQPQVAQHVHRLLQQIAVDCLAAALRLHKLQQALYNAVVHLHGAGKTMWQRSWRRKR